MAGKFLKCYFHWFMKRPEPVLTTLQKFIGEICDYKIAFMKKFAFLLYTMILTFAASSQVLNPVSWSFSSKKINDKLYEVQIVATIQSGWHLYSQVQPGDAIAVPTSFS